MRIVYIHIIGKNPRAPTVGRAPHVATRDRATPDRVPRDARGLSRRLDPILTARDPRARRPRRRPRRDPAPRNAASTRPISRVRASRAPRRGARTTRGSMLDFFSSLATRPRRPRRVARASQSAEVPSRASEAASQGRDAETKRHAPVLRAFLNRGLRRRESPIAGAVGRKTRPVSCECRRA